MNALLVALVDRYTASYAVAAYFNGYFFFICNFNYPLHALQIVLCFLISQFRLLLFQLMHSLAGWQLRHSFLPD